MEPWTIESRRPLVSVPIAGTAAAAASMIGIPHPSWMDGKRTIQLLRIKSSFPGSATKPWKETECSTRNRRDRFMRCGW